MNFPPRGERFFRAALRGMGPLLVWAVHFIACYLLVAWGCVAWGPGVPLRAALIALSAVALGAVGMQGVLAWRQTRTPLAVPAVRWAALLAFLGIAWTAVPLFVLPLCRFD